MVAADERLPPPPAAVDASNGALLDATESWFLQRGTPHFIAEYRATEDVFTRTLPVLTLVLVAELLSAAQLSWPWWQNLLAASGALLAAGLAWTLVNRLRHRPVWQRPDSVGPVELGFFVLVPPLVRLVIGSPCKDSD